MKKSSSRSYIIVNENSIVREEEEKEFRLEASSAEDFRLEVNEICEGLRRVKVLL